MVFDELARGEAEAGSSFLVSQEPADGVGLFLGPVSNQVVASVNRRDSLGGRCCADDG
jgi:hypothetical protein